MGVIRYDLRTLGAVRRQMMEAEAWAWDRARAAWERGDCTEHALRLAASMALAGIVHWLDQQIAAQQDEYGGALAPAIDEAIAKARATMEGGQS